MRFAAVALAALTMAGCSGMTPKELAEEGHKFTIQSSTNYQAVYRNIKAAMSKCFGSDATFLKPSAVDSELYTDIGEGHVVYYQVGPYGGKHAIMDARIIKDNSGTVIKLATASTSMAHKRWPDRIKRWSTGDMTCD